MGAGKEQFRPKQKGESGHGEEGRPGNWLMKDLGKVGGSGSTAGCREKREAPLSIGTQCVYPGHGVVGGKCEDLKIKGPELQPLLLPRHSVVCRMPLSLGPCLCGCIMSRLTSIC